MTIVEDRAPLDEDKLNAFVFRAVEEVGATLNAALVVIGDRLGLYKAMAGAGPLTPAELARTGHRRALHPRVAQQSGRRRVRDLRSGERRLHAAAGAGRRTGRREEPGLPFRGLPDRAGGVCRLPTIEDRFRTGQGLEWGDQAPCLFRGHRALLPFGLLRQPGRRVDAEPRRGGGEAQGRGQGGRRGLRPRRSTLLMAEAFPKSKFQASTTTRARSNRAPAGAEAAGLEGRVRFEVGGRRISPAAATTS